MAISYVGGQVAGRAGVASTLTVTFALTNGTNTTPQPGDLVVITSIVASQGRNEAQAISGYTALGQLLADGTTYDTSLNVSWKVMGNTPDTTFTLPSTGNIADAQRYTVQVWRGVDSSGIASVSATGTSTARPNPGSITPTVAGSVVLICAGGAAVTGTNYTAPTNFTTNFLTGFTADTNDAMVGSGYWTGWTSGAVDPAAYTGGSASATDSWAAYTIVIPPLAAVTRTAPTYVDSTIGGDNSLTVNSVSATAPTMSSGDLDLIFVSAGILSGGGAAPGVQLPSGFTAGPSGVSTAVVGGAVNTRVQTFWKIATGSGSSATLATVGAVNAAIVYTRFSYSGPDATTPIRQGLFGAGASSTSQVLSSMEGHDDSVMLTFLSLGAAETATPPGSMTEREDSGTFGVSSADETLTADGATGTRTFTLGSATDSVWGFIEIQGASAGGGGATGTLAVTESGPDTAASTGSVLVQGSAAATESGSDAFEASDGKLHFIGTSTGGPATALTSLDIAPPPGMKAGHRDLLLVAIGAIEPSAAPAIGTSLGTGWEYLGQSSEIGIGSGVFALRMAAFARVADGPGSDVTVTSDIAGYWGWHRSAWLNPNASTFIGQTAIFGGVSSTTAPVIPGLTTTKSNSYLLQWHVLGELAVITPPGGTTELDENTANALGLYGERAPSISATGSRTYGYSPTSDAGYVVLELHSLVSQTATAQGDLSVTESGSDTAALSGVVVVAGSLSASESGSDTAALAGTVLVSGALAVSEVGSDTAAISGSQVATGNLSISETGSDTAALAGTVLVHGALTVSEVGSDTASLAGNVLVQGALVVSEAGADTAALSGQVLVQGSIAVTESGADVFAATGSLSGGITGNLSATEAGSDTIVASGDVVVTGTLIATEAGADSAAVAGAVVVQGAVAFTEIGSDTFAASGSAPEAITGFLEAIEQGADGASMSGQIFVSGLLGVSEQGSDTALILGLSIEIDETFIARPEPRNWTASQEPRNWTARPTPRNWSART